MLRVSISHAYTSDEHKGVKGRLSGVGESELMLPRSRARRMLRPAWEGEIMLYELRIYECVPGRLPDLLKRFDTITLGIWKRHGIEQAGFWTTAIGDSNQALYYLLKWDRLPTARRNGTRSRPIRNGLARGPRRRRTAPSSHVLKIRSCSQQVSRR